MSQYHCECGAGLKFRAIYAAPGVGQAWECMGCGREWSVVMGIAFPAEDMVHVGDLEDFR